MPSFKMPPPPPPAPTLDIHGFFDVTFANDYITPRGLLVTNSGLTTQLLSGLVFDLYKNPNGFVNNFNVYAGVWNDLWSKQDHPQVGSWNEFDWFVGFGVGFAQYWKVGLQYIVFLSPPGAFRQERNLELAVSFDDGALTGSAFSVNPYVKVFYAISGDSTVVVGKQGGTYDVEIGMLPALALKKINGVPLTITAPTWVTVGPTSYWNNGATGCGTVAIGALLAEQCRRRDDRPPGQARARRDPVAARQLVHQSRLPVLPPDQRQPAAGPDIHRHGRVVPDRSSRRVGWL